MRSVQTDSQKANKYAAGKAKRILISLTFADTLHTSTIYILLMMYSNALINREPFITYAHMVLHTPGNRFLCAGQNNAFRAPFRYCMWAVCVWCTYFHVMRLTRNARRFQTGGQFSIVFDTSANRTHKTVREQR